MQTEGNIAHPGVNGSIELAPLDGEGLKRGFCMSRRLMLTLSR